jgi:hypothetical protein
MLEHGSRPREVHRTGGVKHGTGSRLWLLEWVQESEG